ncbi:MAG: helix-turn-helix domain-containing protein [Lachnospiraceae bacterium]|nr:helix-turn-helix domain-containing protein [Lachnospiraceae bacterium]
MTNKDKEKIRYWRKEGLGYGKIAARLGISENTVKSFCRRNDLAGVASKVHVPVCRQCGKRLVILAKHKEKKFCNDACRRAWWKAHPELVYRQAYYPMVCVHCGVEFKSYGNKKRKYCSHACYIAARFGKEIEK